MRILRITLLLLLIAARGWAQGLPGEEYPVVYTPQVRNFTVDGTTISRYDLISSGDCTELEDTKPRDSAAVWDAQKSPVQLQWGTTDVRYPKWNLPAPLTGPRWSGKAWRGECINAQAVLWSNRALEGIVLSVSDLNGGGAVIPASSVTPHFVRYVMTDELNKDRLGACGHRPDRTQWDSSMVADVLDVRLMHAMQARTTQPLWLSIRVPRDAKPGKYTGTLTVTAEGILPMRLPFQVEVLARTLPEPRQWRFHLDLWQNPYAVARYYGVELWSDAHFEAMRPLMQRLADAGQKVVTATIMYDAWNGQTEPYDAMVTKKKLLDGTWQYDYTVFDRWVEFMETVGIDAQINCFTMIPWALKFDYIDQATGRILFVEAKPGTPAYRAYWFPFLKDFARHLRQKGWFDKTTISMDERGENAMRKTIDLILNADPAYKISFQGHYYPALESSIYDLCLAYGEQMPDEVREARRAAGKVTTVYTCCTEPRPNFFTFSGPAEATWLPWHAMAGGYDGYLRWAYNNWTEDPLRDTRFRRWAAGDCYVVYPGRSSIRMERLVEGVQDAEKIRILREEFAAQGKRKELQRLDAAVAKFVPANLTETNAAAMVTEARTVLNSF